MSDVQVTLMSDKGYKPVSCIINADGLTRQEMKTKGIQKICWKRGWGQRELKLYGYSKLKMRTYNKARIDAEAAARYEAIKEAKYASGEWKKPVDKSK